MQPRKRTDCVCCPVHADVRNILFTQTSSVYAHFFWLDDFENLELSFRKGTLFVADFLCQALERRQLHNACLVSSSWKDSHIKTALQNVLESKCISVTLTVNQCGCLSEEAAAQHGYSRIVLIRPDFVEIIDSDDERGGWTIPAEWESVWVWGGGHILPTPSE